MAGYLATGSEDGESATAPGVPGTGVYFSLPVLTVAVGVLQTDPPAEPEALKMPGREVPAAAHRRQRAQRFGVPVPRFLLSLPCMACGSALWVGSSHAQLLQIGCVVATSAIVLLWLLVQDRVQCGEWGNRGSLGHIAVSVSSFFFFVYSFFRPLFLFLSLVRRCIWWGIPLQFPAVQENLSHHAING